MKIAIYVGSFNPVHKGHIKVVKKILKEYVDKVIIVPTMNYWNKNNLIIRASRQQVAVGLCGVSLPAPLAKSLRLSPPIPLAARHFPVRMSCVLY